MVGRRLELLKFKGLGFSNVFRILKSQPQTGNKEAIWYEMVSVNKKD